MKAKEFIQLFVPPIYYKVKKHLCPKKEVERQSLPKIAHKGKRMVVIGNGPSLNKTMDLYEKQLHEADCVMVNFSARTPLFERIKPIYYVWSDPNTIYENEHEKEANRACVMDIIEKTTWPMTIVLPSYFKNWWAIDEFKRNKNLTILFDEGQWRELAGEELYKAFEDNRVSPPSYTVLTMCIYISLYWGYEETYLVGADTSFTRDMYVGQKDNVLYTIDTHYYNNDDVCPEPTDPEFKGRPFFGSCMETKLHEIYMMFYEYRIMREYAEWKGLKLYNASEFSMIDCLERKKLA